MNRILLANCSWADVKEYLECKQAIILPVGSIEQHGEHLPLGTDTMVAEALALGVAERTNILVGPTISCGWSPHHMVLPGTVTIRPEVLIEYLYDMIHSLHKHGFQHFILINGHRIVNLSWMQISAERAKRELDVFVILADPAFLSKEFSNEQGFGMLGHADEIESSHMLYIQKHLVRLDKVRDYSHDRKPYQQVDPRTANDVLCYVPSNAKEMAASVEMAGGVTGSPSKANGETGEKYHEWIVSKLSGIVSDLMGIENKEEN